MQISDENLGLGPQVICPVCGHDYVHPIETRLFPVKGDSLVTVDVKGVVVAPSDAPSRQRGISIVVKFCCEQGCVWESELKFHKGMTFVSTKELDEIHEIHPERGPSTIWRS